MAGRIFDPESLYWKPFGVLADLLILSLLWTVFSAPLITCGAATAALYDAAARSLRRGGRDTLARFWGTFRRELKGSLPSAALWLALCAAGVGLYRLFLRTAEPGSRSVVLAVAMVALLGLLLGTGCWVFPLLSRFTFSFVSLNRTAVTLALAKLPVTVALAVCAAGGIYVTLRLAFLPLMILPAGMMLLFSLFLEPVFRKYENPAPEENEEE